jgi:hypothetical protein
MMMTATDQHRTSEDHSNAAPIVVVIDRSRAAAAAPREAVRLAQDWRPPWCSCMCVVAPRPRWTSATISAPRRGDAGGATGA